METSIFNYGELPKFEEFTTERINREFPNVIDKINKDFKNSLQIELTKNFQL